MNSKDHIYSLATDFTTFYTECFVIGSEQEKSRLVLLEARAIGLPSCDHDDQPHLDCMELVVVDIYGNGFGRHRTWLWTRIYIYIHIVNLRICSVFCLCSPVLVDCHTDHVYDVELAHFDFERLFWGYDVAGETTTMVRLSFLKHQYHHSQSDTLYLYQVPQHTRNFKSKNTTSKTKQIKGGPGFEDISYIWYNYIYMIYYGTDIRHFQKQRNETKRKK